jgi:hypothetical protein
VGEKIMKIGGMSVNGPSEELLVLPRGEQVIVFRAKSINLDEFDALCPEPKPPGKLTKDGWIPNAEDPNYMQVLATQNEKRIAYLIVKSLEPSDIEWDTVQVDNPRTWTNYLQDFKNAGLTTIEINRIIQCVMQANSLDESKLEQARKVFLHGQAQAQKSSSGQSTEQTSMPSGEPASV